ncbi:MAG: hypothetical protein ACON5F_09050 [Jejuia sp.]
MDNFRNIQQKLERFIKRYHTNELLKGGILFFAIGLLYFLFTLLIEHFLWLNTTLRTILFWLFIAVELGLLVKFVAIPLAKLFKLKKGIDYEKAAKIIGTHFPEVDDKLLNVIQLKESNQESELLLASIEQKSVELNPIPFKLAVNFKQNLSYLKYAVIPLIIVLLVYATGNFNWFSDSYKRVVDYKTAYEPPAPFQFFVVNDDLKAIEGKDFKLLVKTAGDVAPENAQITYNDETYFLQQTGVGEFEYVFSQLQNPITFSLSANEVYSKPYDLDIVEVPSLLSFNMVLDYPNHTKKMNETLKSTGNAVVPEGTKITWQLQTKSTDEVFLYANDTIGFNSDKAGVFEASKHLYRDYDYTLSTSNKNLQDYENLSFSIDVIKDEYPEMNVQMKVDSLDLQTLYFYGQVSDDYGLSKLQLVYYPSDNESDKQVKEIPITSSNVQGFISAFPYNLEIQAGIPYQLYFQVFDNDRVNRFKTKKSSVFSYRKRTLEEEKEKQLQEQGETIKDLNKSLKKFEEQEKRLDELTKTGKEKTQLNFNDKKKLASFFKRQKQQDEMMKNFNKKLKDNLEEFQKEEQKEDAFKEDLKKRLDENEEELKKNEKLLEELEKLQEKINNEELIKKLEEVAKQNKNKKRSLEQLLELTKRFYVEKKLEKLADDLNQLAKEQEELSKASEEENTKEKQDAVNEKFQDYRKQMEELQKASKALKKPIDIPRDKLDEKEVENDQQNASEELEKKENQEPQENSQEGNQPQEENQDSQQQQQQSLQNAQQSQKKAAQKMKQMSKNMQSSMQSMSGERMQEDIEMLRQILDNLVLFSFDEEALMDQFKSIDVNHNKYATYLKKQSYLKEHFEHIDDSLFALSLRQPKMSEDINKEISEVYFNIDKALERLAESQLYQGVSSQQFAVTATNNLADMLSDILDNMQENMSMSMGKGGQGDMQLPDIIMSQEQLNQMMQQGMKKGEQGQPKEGEGKQEGKGEKEGKDGKEGQKGEKGKQQGGKDGENGQQIGGEGEGSGFDEEGLLYEIYQRQQQLREALNKRLEKEGKGGIGDRLSKQMEDIELDLLNKGFTNETLQKMTNLKHQLLKLANATFQQGEDNKRESETNRKQFDNNANTQIPTAKQYFQTTEILNRQALPLQQVYKKKVQQYFKQTND